MFTTTPNFIRAIAAALCLLLALGPTVAHAERIKDIAGIAGVRTNSLVGYGLVVGLDEGAPLGLEVVHDDAGVRGHRFGPPDSTFSMIAFHDKKTVEKSARSGR